MRRAVHRRQQLVGRKRVLSPYHAVGDFVRLGRGGDARGRQLAVAISCWLAYWH